MLIPTQLPAGSHAWLDTEVMDFARQLTAYDDRLALVQNADHSWAIWRVAEDGTEWVVARSRPYAKLDSQVIVELQLRDTRSRAGTSAIDRAIKHNDALASQTRGKAEDELANAFDRVMSKVWHGRTRSDDPEFIV